MSDLISRQAAIEVIDAVFPVDPMQSVHAQGIALGAALAKTYVEQLPSAQSEVDCQKCVFNGFPGFKQFQTEQPEIIRCKDCKYYASSGWCEGIGTCVSSDDFCSRAERREEP